MYLHSILCSLEIGPSLPVSLVFCTLSPYIKVLIEGKTSTCRRLFQIFCVCVADDCYCLFFASKNNYRVALSSREILCKMITIFWLVIVASYNVGRYIVLLKILIYFYCSLILAGDSLRWSNSFSDPAILIVSIRVALWTFDPYWKLIKVISR